MDGTLLAVHVRRPGSLKTIQPDGYSAARSEGMVFSSIATRNNASPTPLLFVSLMLSFSSQPTSGNIYKFVHVVICCFHCYAGKNSSTGQKKIGSSFCDDFQFKVCPILSDTNKVASRVVLVPDAQACIQRYHSRFTGGAAGDVHARSVTARKPAWDLSATVIFFVILPTQTRAGGEARTTYRTRC